MRVRFRQILKTLLVIFCLLSQQVALAAYVCAPAPVPPAPMPAGMAHCAQMDAAPVQVESPGLCEKHCMPDVPVPADAATPGVPALALPPAFPLVFDAPPSHVAQQVERPITRSDPPPRLRYCSLQI